MIIIDTNFIFSLFTTSDTNHQEAVDIFLDLPEKETIKIPYIVMAELLINTRSEDFLVVGKEISGTFISNNDNDLDFIAKLDGSITKKIKSNDCLILALAHRYKAKLITFDKKLINILNKIN